MPKSMSAPPTTIGGTKSTKTQSTRTPAKCVATASVAIRENQAVGHDLLGDGHHLKERVERSHEEAVETPLANEFGHADDREKQRVVQLVAATSRARTRRRHLRKSQPFIEGSCHRHQERAERNPMIDHREDEPHEEVRAVFEHREQVDPPVLRVGAEHGGASVQPSVAPPRSDMTL